MRDDLREVLAHALESDVLVLGSPVYFHDVTGEMRSFLERLLFPSASYDEFGTSTFARQVACGFIFTMNCPKAFVNAEHSRGSPAHRMERSRPRGILVVPIAAP